jgi:hypothetical protein
MEIHKPDEEILLAFRIKEVIELNNYLDSLKWVLLTSTIATIPAKPPHSTKT